MLKKSQHLERHQNSKSDPDLILHQTRKSDPDRHQYRMSDLDRPSRENVGSASRENVGSGSASRECWIRIGLIWCRFTTLVFAFLQHLYSRCKCNRYLQQYCGSGMFIPDPRSRFLLIPDPRSKNSYKREEWKKISCHTFLYSHKFKQNWKLFYFWNAKQKKFGPIFKELLNFSLKKLSLSSQKYGFGIRGFGKNIFWIPGSKRHRIQDPDPQHWFKDIMYSTVPWHWWSASSALCNRRGVCSGCVSLKQKK